MYTGRLAHARTFFTKSKNCGRSAQQLGGKRQELGRKISGSGCYLARSGRQRESRGITMSEATRILALHAHPDDVEFQCAGTLVLLREAGCSITIATMTPGDCG